VSSRESRSDASHKVQPSQEAPGEFVLPLTKK
jgi:hypothetical protein